MKRHVGKWAQFCVLIGTSLALIACGKKSENSYSGAGLPNPSASVVSATTGYSPVVMVVLPGGSGLCTGTFISKKAVLTASHCVSSSGRYSVVSSFGTFYTYTAERLGPGIVEDPSDIA